MENVIANIAEKVSPAAMQAGTPVALKVGTLKYGADIFKTFVGDADVESSQVTLLKHLALEIGLTCDEFNEQCKQAQDIAAETDKATGFVMPEGAKGQDRYGPKRRLLNQRLSEAKRLFGVFKINPDILRERGYWNALDTARSYLDAKNIRWDGEPIPDDAAKATKKVAKGMTKALAEAMAQNPQLPGEDRQEYVVRCDAIAQDLAFETDVQAAMKSILEKHGQGDLILTVCMRILEKHASADILDDCVQLFGETAMIKRMEEVVGQHGA